MAKDVKKAKTKAKINWGWDAPEDRNGKASRTTSNGKRSESISINTRKRSKIKKLGIKAILIVLLITIIGGAIGAGCCYFVCRNDCFKIIGNEYVECVFQKDGAELADENLYVDDGVKIVSFGRDISDKVKVETDLISKGDGVYAAASPGDHYIIYKVDDIKYGKIFTVERIRIIHFVESADDDIVVD